MDDSGILRWLNVDDLAAPVRNVLADTSAVIERWSIHRLSGGISDALGVWRVSGAAHGGGTSRSWSLILKGWPAPTPGATPDGLNWPHREIDLYASGLLSDLPGSIAAPSCLGAIRRPDGTVWILVEDLGDEPSNSWPMERFTGLARQLGQFNGAWLADRQLPDHPSLSRAWIRHRVAASEPFVAELTSAGDHPLVRKVYPPEVANAYQRLWAERERHFAALERLPQVFCHLDAFPRNTFTRNAPSGREETVLIDWAFSGIAALGEELTSLIVASVVFMEAPVDGAHTLETNVLESYTAGLQDTGWRGDSESVRAGYRIAAALRYGVGAVRIWLPLLMNEEYHPIAEQILGQPMSVAVDNGAAVQEWLAGMIPEE